MTQDALSTPATAPPDGPPGAPRPSGTAARLSLAFGVLALLGLLLLPLATLGRSNFDGSGLLLNLYGRTLDFTGSAPAKLPPTGAALGFAWFTLLALLATLYAAVRRAPWLWIAGLASLLGALGAITSLELALSAEVAAQLAAGRRLRRILFVSGGPNLGLVLALVAGCVATFAGLSARQVWWDRLNRLRGLLVPVVAIGLAILVGAVVVLVIQPALNGTGQPLTVADTFTGKADVVWFVYSSLFAPLTNLSDLFQSLTLATPLIFAGLSVALAYRVSLFNIGAPGQLTMGAIAAMLVGVYLPAPGWLLLPLTVVAAGAGGALWGAIPGFLKARFGASEVINTIMLNYIASAVFIFMLGNDSFNWFGNTYALPFKAPGSEAKSYELQSGAILPTISQVLGLQQVGAGQLTLAPLIALVAFFGLYFGLRRVKQRALIAAAVAVAALLLTWRVGVPIQVSANLVGSRLNLAFVLALAGVLFYSVLMWRTARGYALRAVGLSPKAAEYGGVSVARNTVLAMTLAGMFAGLAGIHYTSGGALGEYRLKQTLPTGVGFDGITVALMGQGTPVGVVAASVLFGTLDTGGLYVDQKLDAVNKDIVTVLKALIVLFIAAGGFLSRRVIDPPPPQLVRAVDKGKSIEEVALSPGAALNGRATPQPRVSTPGAGTPAGADAQQPASQREER